ncbi:MAG: AraC family transcriptional regulator [Pelomonas sp.]|nr:AraC family transcriptional regulator [Roseateles sp.]
MVTSTASKLRAAHADEAVQVTLLRAPLAAQIDRLAGGDGVYETAIPRLRLGKVSHTHPPIHTVYEPALCVIAQGSKQVLLGEEMYVYDTSRYLVFAQNLPVTGHVLEASPEMPHLALRLDFDIREIAELALELQISSKSPGKVAQRGIYTEDLTEELLDPLIRLTRLLERKDDIPALAPLIVREILYRLLKSPQGWRLMQLAMVDSNSQRIARVIQTLRKRYRETVRMDDLAREVHLSTSALHHQFKQITAMSPLQYQKQLRLQEARRILLVEDIDAATAGHRVGYDSQSQFNREYSRFFGDPPARDIKRLREAQLAQASRLS